MNNIVNLSQLITRLAKVTDSDPNTARRFLRTFFATIEETLAEGDTVEIKGIGTFRRCDDPAVGTPGTVGFAPANDFAEEINRPFAVFEAVELADGLTAEDLEPETEETPSAEPESQAPAEIIETPETTEEPETPAAEEENTITAEAEPEEEHKAPWEIYGKGPFTAEEKEPETAEETIAEPETETIVRETPPTEEPAEEESEEEEFVETPEYEEAEDKRRKRLWIWITAAGLLLAGIIGYMAAVMAVPIPKYGDDDYDEETEQIETASETEPASETAITEQPTENTAAAEAQPTAPEPETVETPEPVKTKEPKYDTVSAKRYLAIMAREYYGRSIYWVFIYEANTDKISNPNKVAPGTRVLIPDKESLPGSTDAERMAIAEKKAAEIQAKYN